MVRKSRRPQNTAGPLVNAGWHGNDDSLGDSIQREAMRAGRDRECWRDRASRIAGRWLAGLLFLVWAMVLPALQAQAQDVEKVRIAIGQDFSPFEFVDDAGEATGLVADAWRLWSEKTGIEIEFIPLPWAETLEAVRDGRADLHAGLNKSAERDAYLDFSRSIFATNVALFFPTGLGFSHKTNQLAGFEVGVLEGSFEEGLIRKQFPKAKSAISPASTAS